MIHRLLGAFALLALIGCASAGASTSSPSPARDGQGVVLCFAKHLSVWVQVRATPTSRAEGWGTGPSQPFLVAYSSRGFNPVFVRSEGAVIAWMDGERVVQTLRVGPGVEHQSPIQEVTAALVVPPGADLGLTPGDQVRLVSAL